MMPRFPHIQEGDSERWKKALDVVSPRVLAAIEAGALQDGRQLAMHFRNGVNSAILSYVLGDSEQFSQKLEDALARFHLFFSQEYVGRVNAKYVYETSEDALCVALILRNSEVANLAEKLRAFSEGMTDARAEFMSALWALLTNQRSRAEKTARAMKDSAKALGPFLPEAILAISHRNRGQFLAAIEGALVEFDKHVSLEARGTPEAAIFFRGAALVKLYEVVNHEELPQAGLDIRLVPTGSGR